MFGGGYWSYSRTAKFGENPKVVSRVESNGDTSALLRVEEEDMS
jgi:hypothetical protein